MATQSERIAAAKGSVWSRTRVQLGGALLLAAILPWLVRFRIEGEGGDLESLHYSLLGTVIAVLIGHHGFRNVFHYPGVKASFQILPSFMAGFALVMAVFFFARLEYSRLHFVVSFLLSAAWYYLVYFRLRRKRLRIGVLPFGNVQRLYDIPNVGWIPLTSIGDRGSAYDAIVADLRAEIPDEWERFLTDCSLEGILVMHIKQIEESLTGRVAIDHLSENTFGSLIPGVVYRRVKRVGDLAAALIALPILVPIFLAIAIAIRLDSPGPAFFRQERTGFRGRPFTIYKFRTMTLVATAPADAREAAMTRDGDNRVTRVGRLLRRARLDELPQIVNILFGQMSWIGPRPEAVALSQWYEEELPFYRYRHIVRPGITGWAQVSQGHVAEVDDVLWKLHYDFYYIKNFSFWLDLLIVAGTIRTIFSGFGAR